MPHPASQSILSHAQRQASASAAVDGLYLHVPFCSHKCHYCDFYSLVEQPGQDRYRLFLDALVRELELLAGQYDNRPRTLFVGGGTPTLLPPDIWHKLLAALTTQGWLSRVEEFTVEANPETVTDELAQVLASGGVNRVSLGAQSFDLTLLKQLERWHDPRKVEQAMNYFRGVGISNINLDLIFAIPTQTLDQLDADLDAVLALEPTHLSSYNLTYEPNTALTAKLKLGRVNRIEQDLERTMYERVIDRLAAAGFEHYEISNWCKPGKSCAHNLIYWQSQNWLAAGPSACGHIDGYRWKIAPRLGDYLEKSPHPDRLDQEHLTGRAQLGEQLMMRIRLLQGVPLDMLPPDADVQSMIARGWLECTNTHLRLTREGLMFADTVAAALL
ncbi:MAG: radical SAM family heme chaperone HemW [Phycisphaeraceae bacterium]|nr:radical SAM family heme chaperone HemW [Phycisphaeraceae bacterium]